ERWADAVPALEALVTHPDDLEPDIMADLQADLERAYRRMNVE
ncbi:MAG: hypothetical protein ACI81R_002530, partial [Bradymonadia bacterium]